MARSMAAAQPPWRNLSPWSAHASAAGTKNGSMNRPETRSAEPLNPRAMGIVRSGLSVVADAIGITTIRAAYSTTIKGGADVSGGLFDVQGRLVALSDTSMIGHLAPLRCAVRSILADFPPATIRPGDAFIMNDPYRGGVHSNDMQVFNAIFIDGSLRF